MRAIIIAPGHTQGMSLINEHYPTSMIPFLGKPFLQHIVEFLISLDVKKFDFVLNNLPQKVEDFFGNGERWGSDFTFHLAKSADDVYEKLMVVDCKDASSVLLVHETYLPQIDIDENSSYFVDEKSWCGWANISPEELPALSQLNYEGITNYFAEKPSQKIVEKYLCIDSYANTLTSAQKVLNKEIDSLLLHAKEVEPGIWLSRNVSLPSSTKVQPPAYIGESCRFDHEIKLNGNVVIEEGCIIEEKSTLENAIIFPKSYVGEALDLKNVIVDKNRLINTEFNAEIEVVDNFILGNLNDNILKKSMLKLLSQSVAMLIFTLFLPFFLLTIICLKLFRKGPVFFYNNYVMLPAPRDSNLWRDEKFFSFCNQQDINNLSPLRHFFLLFIPGVWQIVKGKMHFVGVPPRSKEEIEKLPTDWRSLYTGSKSGIITEQYVKSLGTTTEDLYASEAFYAVSAGFKKDLQLVFNYFLCVLFGKK